MTTPEPVLTWGGAPLTWRLTGTAWREVGDTRPPASFDVGWLERAGWAGGPGLVALDAASRWLPPALDGMRGRQVEVLPGGPLLDAGRDTSQAAYWSVYALADKPSLEVGGTPPPLLPDDTPEGAVN